MDKIKLLAPAKVNLFLEVLGKRPDGYHEIETVMQTVSLYDRIEIQKTNRSSIKVTSNNFMVPQGQANLAYRAASLVKQHCSVRQGVRILI